jgi:gamma-glutamyl:cysteine ligase YbdK (ATP-grasp superfamily)
VRRASVEIFQSEIEVQTPVCADVPEAARELTRLRAHVARHAEAAGVRVASAGTHPFALFEEQQVTHRARYVELESKWQAVRRGLDARVFTPNGFAPVRDAVASTLERIAPHAEELGGAAHLRGIERILTDGNSAERQVAAFDAVGEVVAVAAGLVAETAMPARELVLARS